MLNRLLGLYLFIYVWAVPMLMLNLVPGWGQGMGGFLIILQGSIMALWLVSELGARGALAATMIGLLAYLVEFVGVTTGVPFGRYLYTPALGPRLGGAVPLAIPFAWLMVIPGALMTAGSLGRPAVVVPVAGALALWLDLLIEPVAAYVTGYWRWVDTGPYYGVPAANFIAWGGTALGLALLLHLLAPGLHQNARVPWLPPIIFGLNVLQFTLVDAAHGFWWPALLGIGLLLCIWLLQGRPVLRRSAARGWSI